MNSKKIMEVIEKITIIQKNTPENVEDPIDVDFKYMQLLKNYLQPLNLLDQEGLPKVLKEIATRMNYSTPKLENGIERKKILKITRNKVYGYPLKNLNHIYF
jgi:hypothetical protein